VVIPDALHQWLQEQRISVVRWRRAPYRNEPNACIHLTTVPPRCPRMDFYLPVGDTPEQMIQRIEKTLLKAQHRAPVDTYAGHSRGAHWAGGRERDFSEVAR